MAMENNSKNYLPPFLNHGAVLYDPSEIEHPLFRYDSRCVGILTLLTSRKLNTDYIGTIELDGKKIHHAFFLHPANPNMPKEQDILCVPVRGRITYDSTHTLYLTGFRDVDDNVTEDMLISVRGASRPDFQKDARTVHEDNVALQAARESMVLLRNTDHVLPIPARETLNFFGSGYTNFRLHSFHNEVVYRHADTLAEAVEKSSYQLNESLDEFYRIPNDRTPDRQTLQQARAYSEYGIMMLSRPSLHGRDVRAIPGEYYLTDEEDLLLRSICHTFPKTVVILNTAYPIHFGWVKKYDVKAILYVGLPGQSGANALLDLFAGTSPCGKLTDSWCYDYEDYPASTNFYSDDSIGRQDNVWLQTCYEEGAYFGYRYFASFPEMRPHLAFPFGFGMSYTTFTITPGFFNPGNRLLSVTIKNVGKVAGKECIQIYVSFPGTLQDHPTHQLVAFQKTPTMDPGESITLNIRIPLRNLSTFLSRENAWFLEAGTYQLWVGNSSKNLIPAGTYENEVPRMLKQMLYHIQSPLAFQTLQPEKKDKANGTHTKVLSEQTALKLKLQLHRENSIDSLDQAGTLFSAEQHGISYKDVKENKNLLTSFLDQLKEDDMVSLLIGRKRQTNVTKRNHLVSLPENRRLHMPEFTFCPGNNGIANDFPTVCMPSSLNLGQTFDRELMQRVGYCIGLEAQRAGVSFVEDTEANIHRIPLSGSNIDSFSEDPYVTGIMLAYKIRGLHDADMKSCVGHVLCANSETSLGNHIALADERTLREIYLRPFDVLFREEKPDGIMASSTIVNHHMCGAYRVLLEGIFRKELGFQGFVITGSKDVAMQGVNSFMAGVSCIIVDNEKQFLLLKKEIETAIQNGSLSKQILQLLVKRLLLTTLE